MHPHASIAIRIPSTRMVLCAGLLSLAGGLCQAQLVNYSEQLGAYKDNQSSGVKLIDATTPGVTARARVARALSQNTVVDQSALVQPDGTLKLPDDQKNIVIRTTYNDVTRAADGTLRIASPTIQGNVTGNVTLFVDGKGVQNITVLNNGR